MMTIMFRADNFQVHDRKENVNDKVTEFGKAVSKLKIRKGKLLVCVRPYAEPENKAKMICLKLHQIREFIPLKTAEGRYFIPVMVDLSEEKKIGALVDIELAKEQEEFK